MEFFDEHILITIFGFLIIEDIISFAKTKKRLYSFLNWENRKRIISSKILTVEQNKKKLRDKFIRKVFLPDTTKMMLESVSDLSLSAQFVKTLDYINLWGPTHVSLNLTICRKIKTLCNEGYNFGKYVELLFPSFVEEFWKDDPDWNLLEYLYGDQYYSIQ
jgi:hypothetical protein